MSKQENKYKRLVDEVVRSIVAQEIVMRNYMLEHNLEGPTEMMMIQRTSMAILAKPLFEYMRKHELKMVSQFVGIYEDLLKHMSEGGATKAVNNSEIQHMLDNINKSDSV